VNLEESMVGLKDQVPPATERRGVTIQEEAKSKIEDIPLNTNLPIHMRGVASI
jgi:hypothetical protein